MRRAVQAEDEKSAAQYQDGDLDNFFGCLAPKSVPQVHIQVAGCTVSAEIVPPTIKATVRQILKILQPISEQEKRRQIRAAAEARDPERRAIYKQQSEAQQKPAPIHTRPPTPGAVDITKSMRPAGPLRGVGARCLAVSDELPPDIDEEEAP